MRAKPIVLLGGTCLVVAASAGLLAGVSSSPLAVEGARESAEPTRAPSMVVRTHAQHTPSVAARPTPTPSTNEAAAGLSPPERDQQLAAEIDANLGERLRAERGDPVWTSETQAAIASTLASPSFAGLRLDAVSCGATLCRVALTAGEQVADVDATVEELTSMDPFRHGGFLRFTGERALTMFVARKGHPLPPPPRT